MQVHAAHGKGMGPKAMLLLAGLAQEAELLHVLRSLLQPPDYACLVAIARRAVSARHTAFLHVILCRGFLKYQLECAHLCAQDSIEGNPLSQSAGAVC